MPDSERRSGLPGGEQREAGLGQNESPGADIIRAGAQGKTDSFGHLTSGHPNDILQPKD